MTTTRKVRAGALLLAAASLAASCDYFGDGQRSYSTPEAAVDALLAAVQSGKTDAMLRVLGADAKSLIESGDPIADANTREEFAARLAEKRQLVNDVADEATLVVGADDWPFPFPLVNGERGWQFDTTAGADEIIDRRIGENELSAIKSCLAYVDAQSEYYARNPDGAAVLHYARHLISQPEQKNGLFWEAADGEPPSPLGALFAKARASGYLQEGAPRPEPFHGYYYRLLEAQGPDAAGGAYEYIVGEQMVGGHALLAYPAERGSTGVMTFIVNHDGVVFSKDLGPDTAELAPKIATFNPDSSWKRE